MKTVIATVGVALAAFLASTAAVAQNDVAGEARAAPSKPSTKEEKKAARAKRQAGGKDLAKQDAGRTDSPNPGGVAKGNTKEDKAAARAARQAEGKDVAKKDQGRLEDSSGLPPQKK